MMEGEGNITLGFAKSNKKRRREGTQETSRQPGTAPTPERSFGVAPTAPVRKYSRGAGNTLDSVKDKKLRSKILQGEDLAKRSTKVAAHSELLLENEAGYLEAEGMERTYKFRQADIAAAVDVAVARKSFELRLDTYGPYRVDYSRNGRYMLLAGSKGHLAVVDWEGPRVSTEFHVHETVRDACFLHSSMMFAVAQKQYAYIYDHTGMQIHALRNHIQPLALAFLPHHFLLASVGNAGYLKYQDVSTGSLVAEHATRMGACDVMRPNPWNAVLCCGHTNGVVTMWTPNLSAPAAKMLVHRGPVTTLAIDAGGRYMATAGMDARLKVWDVRAFRSEPVHNYFLPSPARSIDVSQTGLCAVGFGSHVQVWGRNFGLEALPLHGAAPQAAYLAAAVAANTGTAKTARPQAAAVLGRWKSTDEDDEDEKGDDSIVSSEGEAALEAHSGPAHVLARKQAAALKASLRAAAAAALPRGIHKASAPYMRHELPGRPVECVRFKPFDDILAVGTASGLASMIVPGAGEPNPDSRSADPLLGKKARAEAEVHALLDKLQPTTIALDPSAVGAVNAAGAEARRKSDAAAAAARGARDVKELKPGGKLSKSQRKRQRKHANIVTAQAAAAREQQLAAKLEARDRARSRVEAGDDSVDEGGSRHAASALSRFYVKSKV